MRAATRVPGELLTRSEHRLKPDPSRTLGRLFVPGQETLIQGESRATPVIDQAASVAVGTVGYGVQLTGQTMRNVAGRTGAGIQSLARSWRDRHR